MTETPHSRDLLREAARRFGTPLWQRLRPYVDTAVARRVEQHTRQTVDNLRAADAAAGAELDQLGGRVAWTENEMRRMSAHLAAVDERLAGVERPVTPGQSGETEDHEARTLVDEIREEHARIRARLTAIARYEERIGRLEAAIDRAAIDRAAMDSGDMGHRAAEGSPVPRSVG
jgi:predicted  nucleic acid-binding Zn-ribbon protein